MTILFYVFFYITLLALFHWVYIQFFSERLMVKERLKAVQGKDESTDARAEDTFIQRIIQPLYNRFFRYLQRIAPSSIRLEYKSILDASGLGHKMTYTNIIIIQILTSLVGVMLMITLSTIDNKGGVILAVAGTLFYLPVAVLRVKGKKRQEELTHELPGFLDLVYVTVEAGLSFDMALQNTLEQLKGPLAEEFSRTMDEINHGRNRSEAFRGLAKRTQVEEIKRFVTSIILAEELGSNIGNVLRVQSATVRKVRKQRAEEMAGKIPVKMTFPLVLLMFPALFIVILGPAVISLMKNFL